MKYIGEQFKEKREEIGISIAEVSNDLKVDGVVIENLEDGNDKVFKDILELKDMVSLYAKYLDLDEEKLLDELNDYLFEKTSKISIDDINNSFIKTQTEEKKISTPYTADLKDKKNSYTLIIIFVLLAFILLIFYFVLKKNIVG